MWTVYILACADGKKYIGCTGDLDSRLAAHRAKQVKSTCNRLPVELITYICFTNKYKAFNFERYIKSGSGHAFMNKRLV